MGRAGRKAKLMDYLASDMQLFWFMKPLTIIGIVLIVFGVFVLASEGISYTKTEKVLDIGPVEATATRHKTIPIPPLAGGAAVAAGLALVFVGAKRP
jgi:hypothetical protein